LLLPWLSLRELFTCGIVRAEVLRGLVKASIKTGMSSFFDLVPHLPTDETLWSETAELAWKLDRTGIILPLTDLAKACCALRAKATVITSDRHFSKIPGLEVRGSV
jgi:predicted nucleic acid-binding protein